MRKSIAICAVAMLATVALASVAAAPAQAVETTLCKTNVTSPVCAASHRYAPTNLEVVGEASFSAGPTFNCSGSVIEIETKATVGSPKLPASMFHFSLSGCTESGNACTANVHGAPYGAEISWAFGDIGVLLTSGAHEPEFEFSCGLVHCVLTTASLELGIEGGNPATGNSSAALTSVGSGSCNASGSYTGKYTYALPKPLFPEHT